MPAARDRQTAAGRLEVIVRLGPLTRPELLLILPLGHHVLIDDASAAEIVTGGLLVRARFVRRRVVRQNQRVLAILVLEIVADALFFHQAGNEVEIRLAILHAVIASDEIAVETKLEIGEAEILENLLYDGGSFLVLEDAAIGGARQEPEPGDHLRAVGGQAAILRSLGEAADEAVPMPLLAIGVVDAQRDALAHHVLELDRIVFGQQVQIEMEKLRDGFGARETAQQEHVLAERGRDRDAAVLLCDRHQFTHPKTASPASI